jgi:hypothetical protein
MKEKLDADDLCTLLGGEFDFESSQCTFFVPGGHEKATIFNRTAFLFFILQLVIGCSTTVFAVYYNPIVIPMAWWTQYLVLAISFAIAFTMYWIKANNVAEAMTRSLISLVTIVLFATAIGCLIHWDLLVYASIVAFAGEPVTASISGIIVAALISFVISPPEEQKESSKKRKSAGTFPLYA